MKYLVSGTVEGIGRRDHVIHAKTEAAAWQRYERTYSKFKCTHIQTRRVGE